MKKLTFGLLGISLIAALFLISCSQAETPETTPTQTETPTAPAETEPAPGTLAHAGRLYDKWWSEIGQDAPSQDNPVWSRQTTNTRSGADTWRCKECHGWDYRGVDGAYSSGSHRTGFPGLQQASSKSRDELTRILTGQVDSEHDFSGLTDLHVGHLVDFLKWGMIDDTQYINYETKAVIGADMDNGRTRYESTCTPCHGADGKMIDIDGAGLGAIANGNPWETLHKIRFGHPASGMPSAIQNGWSTQDAVDVLGYSQTLPE